MIASGTNREFNHQITSATSPDAIWALWMDVPGWKHWDQGLADASAELPLSLGSRGIIKPKSGPDSPFEITEFVEGKSYAFQTKLPAAKLQVRRFIVSEQPTIFRHEVSFLGPLAWLWGAVLGRVFRTALPPTMDALEALAGNQGKST